MHSCFLTQDCVQLGTWPTSFAAGSSACGLQRRNERHPLVAGRLSYLYSLNGPSIAIDTACSSSLVAVGTARDSLLLGVSGGALAGGINLLLSPATMAMYAVAGAVHDVCVAALYTIKLNCFLCCSRRPCSSTAPEPSSAREAAAVLPGCKCLLEREASVYGHGHERFCRNI